MADRKIKRHSKRSRASQLAAEHESALEQGKVHYSLADEKFEALLEIAKAGHEIELPDGRIVEIVDNFIDPKTGKPRNKAFKPAGVNRFALKVKSQHA